MRDKGSMKDILFEDITVSAQHCEPRFRCLLHFTLQPMDRSSIRSPARSALTMLLCHISVCLAMAALNETEE